MAEVYEFDGGNTYSAWWLCEEDDVHYFALMWWAPSGELVGGGIHGVTEEDDEYGVLAYLAGLHEGSGQ